MLRDIIAFIAWIRRSGLSSKFIYDSQDFALSLPPPDLNTQPSNNRDSPSRATVLSLHNSLKWAATCIGRSACSRARTSTHRICSCPAVTKLPLIARLRSASMRSTTSAQSLQFQSSSSSDCSRESETGRAGYEAKWPARLRYSLCGMCDWAS